jgi:hypothetical protein
MKNIIYLLLLSISVLCIQSLLEAQTWFLLTMWREIFKGDATWYDFFFSNLTYFFIKVFVVTIVPYVITFLLAASWILKSKTVRSGYIKITLLHSILMIVPALIYLFYIENGKLGITPIFTLFFYTFSFAFVLFRKKPLQDKIFKNSLSIQAEKLLLNTGLVICLTMCVIAAIFYFLDSNNQILKPWSNLLVALGILFLLLFSILYLIIGYYKRKTNKAH